MDCLARRAKEDKSADARTSEMEGMRDLGFDVERWRVAAGGAGGGEEGRDGYVDACGRRSLGFKLRIHRSVQLIYIGRTIM